MSFSIARRGLMGCVVGLGLSSLVPHEAQAGTGCPVSQSRVGKMQVLHFGPSGGPRVLLLHGFQGKAVRLSELACRMAKAGLQVVAPQLYDSFLPWQAPSQDDEMSRVEDVAQIHPPDAVWAHSRGAQAALRLAHDRHIPAILFDPVDGLPLFRQRSFFGLARFLNQPVLVFGTEFGARGFPAPCAPQGVNHRTLAPLLPTGSRHLELARTGHNDVENGDLLRGPQMPGSCRVGDTPRATQERAATETISFLFDLGIL